MIASAMLTHLKKLFLLVLLPGAGGAIFLVSGLEYVPVELSTGRCFMDYSHPSAYQHRTEMLNQMKLPVDKGDAILCYSSPPFLEAPVLGSSIKLGEPWMMGSHEPTRLYSNKDFMIGDLKLAKGRYSIYAVPDRQYWHIFINSSITHWGDQITLSVRSKDVGSIRVKREYVPEPVKRLRFRAAEDYLIMEWDHTRLSIPFSEVTE